MLCVTIRLVTWTRINLDDEALEQARQRLGTRSKVETVDTALRLEGETGPQPRCRYVPTRDLQEAMRDQPPLSFEELRADADSAVDDTLESEEAHLDELFDNAPDSVWHTR